MSKLKDLKTRIVSVTKTRKMTQAMKMVSAAKFKRASDEILKFRPYYTSFEDFIYVLQHHGEHSDNHPLFKSNGVDKELVIVLTADRGLCGGFNTNVVKEAMSYCKSKKSVDVVCIGRKAIQLFKRSSFNVIKTYEGFEHNSLKQVRQIIRPLKHEFLKKKYGKIVLFHTQFKSAISSFVDSLQIMPIYVKTDDDPVLQDYIFEPDSFNLFENLSVDFVYLSVYKAFLESKAAEEGSRMAAMDAATDNAKDMIDQLSLMYNRVRQAKITTELAEIVAGANALA